MAARRKDIQRERIARPYGGHIVVTAPELPGATEFFARVRRWLEEAPIEQELFDDGSYAAGERDIADVIAAAAEWPISDDARRVWQASSIAYEPVRKPPVEGEEFKTGIGIELRGVSYFVAHARDQGSLYQTERGMAITHEETSHIAEIELRSSVVGAQLNTIKSGLARFSGVTQDIVALLLANAFNNEADQRGFYPVDIDALLDARELVPKKAGKYNSGHHIEARVAVVESIQQLSNLFVATDPISKKHRRRRIFDSVLMVDRFETVDDSENDNLTSFDQIDPRKVVSIRYRFGEWFEAVKAFQLNAPRSVLALDAQRESTAKKLGHYFVQRAHDTDEDRRIVRPIRSIFREAAISAEPTNPQRTRNRLEGALDKLVQIKALEAWGYLDPINDLPLYKWLDPWLDLRVWARIR